jgi:hypothetical protein
MSRGCRGDRGQVSAEFMGLIVVLAIVISALAVGGFGGQISAGLQAAVCKIYGGSCSIQSVLHEPEAECETLNSTGEASADIVAFSVDLGGKAKYTLSRTVDKDGQQHWYVTLEGQVGAGADVMFGEDAHLGDLGEGVNAEVKAMLIGGGGTKYEFPNEKAARGFITDSEHELVKQAVLPSYDDPFGWGHKLLNKLDGHSFKPPPAKEYFFQGGGQVNGSLDAVAGAAKVGGSTTNTAVVGVKVEPGNDDHGAERTVYLQLSSESAAKLGLFDTVGGELGVGNEVVLGVTYDDKGQAVKASVEAAGDLKAQFGPEASGPDTKLGTFAGLKPEGAPEGGLSVGGGLTAKADFELDLTQGDNRRVLADGLHSIGVPVLTGDGSKNAPNPYDGIKGVYNLFDNGAPGTELTVTTYTTSSNDNDLSVKGGDALAFGVEGGLNFEDEKVQAGAYYSPGAGFVRWEQCSK